MQRIININWNDIQSIKKAERKKARLENMGFSLADTQNFNQTSILTYRKP